MMPASPARRAMSLTGSPSVHATYIGGHQEHDIYITGTDGHPYALSRVDLSEWSPAQDLYALLQVPGASASLLDGSPSRYSSMLTTDPTHVQHSVRRLHAGYPVGDSVVPVCGQPQASRVLAHSALWCPSRALCRRARDEGGQAHVGSTQYHCGRCDVSCRAASYVHRACRALRAPLGCVSTIRWSPPTRNTSTDAGRIATQWPWPPSSANGKLPCST